MKFLKRILARFGYYKSGDIGRYIEQKKYSIALVRSEKVIDYLELYKAQHTDALEMKKREAINELLHQVRDMVEVEDVYEERFRGRRITASLLIARRLE